MSASLTLLAPFSGTTIPLEAVPDAVFSARMMGDGLAIDPHAAHGGPPGPDRLLASCAGTITQMMPSAHALIITHANGAEVMLHIGIDSFRLKGRGMRALVQEGDTVHAGQPLVEVDWATVMEAASSPITVLVLINGNRFRCGTAQSGMVRAGAAWLEIQRTTSEITEISPKAPDADPEKTASKHIPAEKKSKRSEEKSGKPHSAWETSGKADLPPHEKYRPPGLFDDVMLPENRAGSAAQRAENCPPSATPGVCANDGMPLAQADTDKERGASEALVSVRLGHEGGLHARPAARVQLAASAFQAQVVLRFRGREARVRSMVSLLGLGVEQGDELSVYAHGAPDSAAAAQAVADALRMHGVGLPPSSGQVATSLSRAEGAARAAARAAAEIPLAASGPVSKPPLIRTRTAPQDGTSANNPPEGVSAMPLHETLHCCQGECASPGIAVGRVLRVDIYEPEVEKHASDVTYEYDRFFAAIQQAQADLSAAMLDAGLRNIRQQRDMLNAHLSMLQDPELIASTEQLIDQGMTAAYAFRHTVRVNCEMLRRLGNPLLAERVSDLRDIEGRVLRAMLGEQAPDLDLAEDTIIIADDLAPSDFARLPKNHVRGIATLGGGATSHLAILARSQNIPTLVACEPSLLALHDGQEVVLDANQGYLALRPDAQTLRTAREQIDQHRATHQAMLQAAREVARTCDGHLIEVYANVANAEEARRSVDNGAEGVGLLRTEFLFIDRAEAPDEAEQRAAYQAVLDALEGRPAIIRTLDIGGDKSAPYLTLPLEENPELGLRGIRASFAYPELFDTQLMALLSVAQPERVRIMLPMVAEADDLIRVRQRMEELARARGIPHVSLPQLGAMIEIPSAALLCEQLAAHADFFSIGTNDLSQYTLAIDRRHARLARNLDALHPAVLRLIRQTVEGARRHDKPVGVCGALASDLDAIPMLVGLGVRSLSVVPHMAPEIKARIRLLDLAHCRQAADDLLARHTTAATMRAALRQINAGLKPERHFESDAEPNTALAPSPSSPLLPDSRQGPAP